MLWICAKKKTPGRRALGVVALAGILFVGGCDKQNGSTAKAATASSGPAAAAVGDGVIRGRVILVGNSLPARTLPGSPMVKDESIVAGADGGLKNVIVFLKNAPAEVRTPQSPVVLDQINCTFVPHVLAMQAGQELAIKSSDNLMHNAHLQCVVNSDANFGFAGPGEHDVVLASAEAPFRVKCDVHPWMTAWVGVFPNPWFAVTDAGGNFAIDHVPPGHYTLAAWQEALPQQQQPVEVTDQKPAEVLFSFQAP